MLLIKQLQNNIMYIDVLCVFKIDKINCDMIKNITAKIYMFEIFFLRKYLNSGIFQTINDERNII